jgi:uncharacterized protein (TIGR00255 family)
MTLSMTGFATCSGQLDGYSWTWEIRAVNGRGLELRIRVPEWIEGLEGAARKATKGVAARGNITLNCKITRQENGTGFRVDEARLRNVLDALKQIEQSAVDHDVNTTPPSSAEILAYRGVVDTEAASTDTALLSAAILSDLPALLTGFNQMRSDEGSALHCILADQLNQIEALTDQAANIIETRAHTMKTRFAESLERVSASLEGDIDTGRVAQEIALLAVKADVAEELDRLRAHIVAGRELLTQAGAKGRKMDFLSQEFNREANTLCAKANHMELTTIGLALKAVIDQMREQIQNVE